MKPHHPIDRAERLRIKKIKFEKTGFAKEDKGFARKVRRSILKAQIKEQETEDELRRVWSQGSLDPIVP
jgi:hypothetical protein